MLSREEKAYCRALEALQKKDYITADKEFGNCDSLFAESRGYKIISEATRLLVQLQKEKEQLSNIETEIEEAVCHGEETVVCGQGEQEETC
jgi:hypothetical protein